jgi:hypothetical protein
MHREKKARRARKRRFTPKYLSQKEKEPIESIIGSLCKALFLEVQLILSFLLCCEACAAINRLTLGRLEGNLALCTALNANGSKHLSCTLLRILLSGAALLASGGLVLESLGCVEFLLTCGEHEVIATVSALQSFVLEHVFFSSLKIGYYFALGRIPTDAFVIDQRSPLSYSGIMTN